MSLSTLAEAAAGAMLQGQITLDDIEEWFERRIDASDPDALELHRIDTRCQQWCAEEDRFVFPAFECWRDTVVNLAELMKLQAAPQQEDRSQEHI